MTLFLVSLSECKHLYCMSGVYRWCKTGVALQGCGKTVRHSSMSSTNPATSDSDNEWGAAAKSKRSKRSGIFYGVSRDNYLK